MRQVTVTEKYRAVNEGQMAKQEFVRQMRLAFPSLINQFNGYDDSVSILRTKGLLFEEKTMKHDVSDESIRRALDAEITVLGHDPVTCTDSDVIDKARAKAIANLSKDPLHYYNLLSKESSKVDKNDQPKETKRGALEKDTFNDMKKATLKERKERLVEGTRALVGYLAGDRLTTTYNHYDGYPSHLGKALQMHYNDDDKAKEIAMKGYITGIDADTGDVSATHKEKPGKLVLPDDKEQRAREIAEEIDSYGAEYGYVWDDNSNQWVTIKNTGIRSMIDQIIEKLDMVNVHSGETMEGDLEETEEEYLAKKDAAIKQAMGKDVEEVIEVPTLKETLGGIVAFLKSKGAGNESIKDFIKMHKDDIQGMDMDDVEDEYKNFISVNTDYVDETDAYDNDDDTQDMIDKMRKDGKDADDFVDEKKLNEEGIEDANYKMGEAFKKYGIDLSRDVIVIEMDGGTPQYGGGKLDKGPAEPAMLVAKRLEQHRLDAILEWESDGKNVDFPVMYEDGFYGDYTPEGTEHKLTYSEDGGTMWDIFQAPSKMSEKKGKDHDGDGDVDGDDYMHAKDKAIKKAMGKKSNVNEAVKNIITKVLEEQLVNEAATNDLAKIAAEYGDFEGLKPAVIALENVVTEIESFYDKTRSKIQKIYNDLGEIRNEEGLKVGAFIAPSIENAFKRDLRPIIKQQFHGGLEMPKVKRISQAEVDRGYTQMESPKETVFTPVNEKK